jgi:hypothetical protein
MAQAPAWLLGIGLGSNELCPVRLVGLVDDLGERPRVASRPM